MSEDIKCAATLGRNSKKEGASCKALAKDGSIYCGKHKHKHKHLENKEENSTKESPTKSGNIATKESPTKESPTKAVFTKESPILKELHNVFATIINRKSQGLEFVDYDL
jgi:hypothetical protein